MLTLAKYRPNIAQISVCVLRVAYKIKLIIHMRSDVIHYYYYYILIVLSESYKRTSVKSYIYIYFLYLFYVILFTNLYLHLDMLLHVSLLN